MATGGKNLRDLGYPSSYTKSTGTNGLNLTQLGYPSSTSGYTGASTSTALKSTSTGSSKKTTSKSTAKKTTSTAPLVTNSTYYEEPAQTYSTPSNSGLEITDSYYAPSVDTPSRRM